MADSRKDNSELPEKTLEKIEGREKKSKPKMRVSGKRVFQLKKLLKKSPR